MLASHPVIFFLVVLGIGFISVFVMLVFAFFAAIISIKMYSIKNMDTNSDTYDSKGRKFIYRFIKRVFDFICSLLFLVCLIPVFFIISCVIKFEDHGPVVYGHQRVGKYGNPITIFKFRTMREGAELSEKFLTYEQIQQYHHEFKIDHDPRITRTGRFLRMTSLDELPQLWNVLKGEMSIVGPRPLVQEELFSKYTYEERRRLLSVRPGMTGLWQVNGRNNCTYESGKRQKLELKYIEEQGIKTDIKILIRTVFVVIKKSGAR